MLLGDIFTFFTTFFNDFWKVIEHAFGEFGTFLKMIFYTYKTLNYMVESLPPFLITFASITILVSLLYLIFGRSTGGFKND